MVSDDGFRDQSQQLAREEKKEKRETGETRKELQQGPHASHLMGSLRAPSSLVRFVLFF